ncbi:unnamed protein product [Cuscuta campestris]|uniref:Uncharacterized protein n=1 Tax=Cuscuta campestris TaxID=132261 RepID=A0A484MKC6_9ASTE|nr:unnamed protein product [Cuscuta campestris]
MPPICDRTKPVQWLAKMPSEKARDAFVHMVKVATTLHVPIVEDIDGTNESSKESHIKEDDYSGSSIVGNDGGAIDENDGATIQSDKPSYKSDFTPHDLYVPLNNSVGVTIAEYAVLASIFKMTNADNKRVDKLILFNDTIKLFDIVDVVKTEHLVSPRANTCATCLVSYFHNFATRAKMVEDSKSGLLLWFSTISPVQKHKWEPPP